MADVSSIAGGSQRTIEQIIEEQSKKKQNTRNTGELGKDDFLKLLITQVQHQDPLNPASDTDFIAQIAQFSALEQMQNLNTSFAFSKGFSLIGKYVTGQIIDEATGDTKYVSGLVESARMNAGKVYVIVDGKEINVDQITDVYDNAFDSYNANISDYSGLIGMLGKSYISNDSGKVASIEGIVTALTRKSGGIIARLDEVDILPDNLDMTGFDSPEAYVQAYAGREITVRFKDPDTGYEFRVTGTLRDGYLDNDGSLRLILDDVSVPVENIFETKRVDLLSTEQMLLSQILRTLREIQGGQDTGEEETGVDEEGVDEVDGTAEAGSGADAGDAPEEPGEDSQV
jgi:flagellar basal-body rod modification protein FlgD